MRLRLAMVGGCEMKAEICGDRYVDRFDLVLVSYGFDGLTGLIFF